MVGESMGNEETTSVFFTTGDVMVLLSHRRRRALSMQNKSGDNVEKQMHTRYSRVIFYAGIASVGSDTTN